METARLRTERGLREIVLHGTPWISMVNVGPTGTNCLGKTLAASPCMTEFQSDPVVGGIVHAAIEVHRVLGPGLLESTYQHCLIYELAQQGIPFEQQVPVPVIYKGTKLDCGYRLDLLVEGSVIVEVKSVEKLLAIHTAQVLTYLRLTGARRALLMNFNGVTLKQGLRSYLGMGNFVPGTGE
jgi:GxxExxY protein